MDEKETKEEEQEEKQEETKEKSLEEKYKELEEKYNVLLNEKVTKDREAKHNESYKKYDLSEENTKLLKRYLFEKDDIEEELKTLSKDFPHLFNQNKDTNINNSLDVQDYHDKEKETKEKIDEAKLGMVG